MDIHMPVMDGVQATPGDPRGRAPLGPSPHPDHRRHRQRPDPRTHAVRRGGHGRPGAQAGRDPAPGRGPGQGAVAGRRGRGRHARRGCGRRKRQRLSVKV
ncbi:hypothetical protein ACRAWD_05980 [Caulobacter segnis]